MMKIKTTFKYASGALIVLVMLVAFAIPGKASASYDDYGLDDSYGFNDDYYVDYPIYNQSYANDDYYVDYPIYSQSYANDDYYVDYPIYNQSYANDDYYVDYPIYNQSYYYQPYQQPQSTPYMYTPQPNYAYQYNTPSTGGSNVNTNVSNSSSNSTATNTNVNNNNNVNNNPINIVINGGIPVNGTTHNNSYQSLDGNCYISPSNIYINQDVSFTANATGGNGNYTYSWSGSDGISSNSRSFTGRFSTFGQKSATVIISSNGQSISRTCSANVEGNNYQNNNLAVYCIASPITATVGQNVIWTAYVTGGNSYAGYANSYGYTYSWSGTDGLSYGNAQAIQKTYSTGGLKTATVTVYGNGQTQTASCNMTVSGGVSGSNVTVIREPGAGQPISGVFLSQVPATGISFGWKVALFILGLLIWSGYVGYAMVSRRKRALATASISAGAMPKNASAADRINQFKIDNMRKKGLIQ